MITKVAPIPSRGHHTLLSWVAQVMFGVALFGAGIEIAFVFGTAWWYAAAGSAFACSLGLAVVIHAELKERPRRLLRKARRSLSFPPQWSVKFNRRVGQIGMVPVAVVRTDGVRFVIDIQTHKSVSWGTPRDGTGQTPLVGPSGKPIRPDPVTPLVQTALAASAVPVMWLPEADSPRNLRHPDTNLIVVMGNARDLKHALQSAEIARTRPLAPADNEEPEHLPKAA